MIDQSKAFLVSFVFAGLAMLMVYLWVNDQNQQASSRYGEEIEVIVANQDIQELQVIERSHLTIATFPRKFTYENESVVIPPNVSDEERIKIVSSIEGTVASAPFRKGEQILMNKLILKGAKTGLASQVSVSHRAMSIPVTESTGVNKLLQPGDRVDIIASIPYSTGNGQQSEVKTILQNVHLLAVGEMIQNEIPSIFKNDPVSGNKKQVSLRGSRAFSTVSVEVSPIEAQALIYVLSAGADLFLTLRNPVDRSQVSVPTTTVDEVLGQNSKKVTREIASKKALEVPAVIEKKKVEAPLPPPPPPNPFKTGGGSLVP